MTTAEPNRRRAPRGFVLTTVLAGMLFGVLALYSFHPRLPFNAIRLPGEKSQLEPGAFPIQLVMPQGWKFFTKSPRDPEVTVFGKGNPGADWKPVNGEVIADSSGLLNFDRTSRAVGVEMALILHEVKKTDWSADCRDTDRACLAKVTAEPRTVKNTMPHPQLCGLLGFVSRAPVPFAYANSLKSPMPSNTLTLRVQCEG